MRHFNLFLRNTGFTLVELMVSALILSIIFLAVFSLLTTGNRLWQTDSVWGEIQAKARIGMNFMTKELYGSKVINPDIGLSADNISFQLPTSTALGQITWGSTIQYLVSSNGQLVRCQTCDGTDDKIIADNVSTVLFQHAESDVVTIALTLQKNTVFQEPLSITLHAQVTLRN